MLVYGDPQSAAGPEDVLSWIRGRLEQADNCDRLRAVLIEAGQLEQALADTCQFTGACDGVDTRLIAACQALTDALASALVASHAAGPVQLMAARACLDALGKCLRASPKHAQSALQVKLPEGFEFYSLYPEQYVVSAEAWAQAHAQEHEKSACVIGVRGIGTTLSAVVSAALRCAGWRVERFTVRPTGHPFHRTVSLGNQAGEGNFRALIVDEGPGLSGSSLASVAEALAARGFPASHISFFPGHRGEPGPAASERTRYWWRVVPRWVTQGEEIKWPLHSESDSSTQASSPVTLLDVLRLRSAALLQARGETGTLHDVSGGGWRQFAFSNGAEWPAVAGRFGRPKYLFRTGTGQGVLWRFVGLGAFVDPDLTGTDLVLGQIYRLAEGGWTAPPLEVRHGFLATRWIEGRRLDRRDAQSAGVLDFLANYIVAAAGPALSQTEQEEACRRLIEFTVSNLHEACGEAAASRAGSLLEELRRHQPSRSYGDGRMMPYKWIEPTHPASRTTSRPASPRRLLKLDCAGHSHDHTCVGKQSVLWDVAGVLVEWALDARTRDTFLKPLRPAIPELEKGALSAYTLAYASFRLGMTTLCADAEPPDSDEVPRLHAAQEFYKAAARQILEL